MRRLAKPMLAAMAALAGLSPAAAAKPRLVVGIVVDQLRTDILDDLRAWFGEKGFNTLFAEGVTLRDVDFKVPGTEPTRATAMLMTGAYPSDNGITGAFVSDPSLPSGLRMPLVKGNSTNITNDSFTPEGLRLSTLADELAVAEGGNATVYSVAIDPQQAILLAGHAGTGAFWVNNTSGNWATTSWYGPLPQSISARNTRGGLTARMDTMVWRPSARLNDFARQEGLRPATFKYTFGRNDRDAFRKFAASPLANAEVTTAAVNLIRNLPVRTDKGTDMVNVAYSLAPWKHSPQATTGMELADSYLKLDAQLSRLFDAIDKSVGRKNALIWLSGTGGFDEAVAEEKRYRIPTGEFSAKKAKSLLNSYLSARHGNAAYVTAIRDCQVFFDHRVLESTNAGATQVIDDAREFIVKMSGVSDAFTLAEILNPTTEGTRNLRLAVNPAASGGIFLKFTPGWEIQYDETLPVQTRHVRESGVMTPAFILGGGLKPTVVSTPVDATALAPTISGMLRIRPPNGAAARALDFTAR